MKKTLIIVDHPQFDCSKVNRRWVEELKKYPDEFTVHNLQSSYVRHVIDPSKEHSLLENHGAVVLQFPLYWYNCPPLMKSWFETVFTPDWAYGKQYKLEHKKIALAVSCGSAEEDYTEQGRHHRPVLDYLNSLVHSIEYVKADFAGLYTLYGANAAATSSKNQTEAADLIETLRKSAEQYVEFLRGLQTE
ncbi:MAG: NAD(P)H-dependent oxidoreductase [Succinivibrio sp.]|nr:NAD(P)H-dependent oxidoreductase [Succinivibrio sp.]